MGDQGFDAGSILLEIRASTDKLQADFSQAKGALTQFQGQTIQALDQVKGSGDSLAQTFENVSLRSAASFARMTNRLLAMGLLIHAFSAKSAENLGRLGKAVQGGEQ